MNTAKAVIDPYRIFSQWYAEAQKSELSYPDAASLATIGEDGFPDVRIVLMKEYDLDGFIFYTNYEGKKGRDLTSMPKAAMCFYWKSLNKQVRVIGCVEKITSGESDKYFASRPRLSQIGAWASHQSAVMKGQFELERCVAELTLKFNIKPIPRPEHWGGYRLIPTRIEFWEEGKYRLHRRREFLKTGTGWKMNYLFP